MLQITNSYVYIYIITFINLFVIFLHSIVSKIAALTLCKILARLHFLLQFLLQFPGVPPLYFLGLHTTASELKDEDDDVAVVDDKFIIFTMITVTQTTIFYLQFIFCWCFVPNCAGHTVIIVKSLTSIYSKSYKLLKYE